MPAMADKPRQIKELGPFQTIRHQYQCWVRAILGREGDNVVGILSRLFGAGPDDRTRTNDKRQKFQELERQFAGNAEMIKGAKALWLTNRGNYYGGRRHMDQAIEDFQEAITFKPDHIPAFLGLGIAYKYKGMFQKALSILKSAPRTSTIAGQKHDADPAMVRQLNAAMYQELDTLIQELEPALLR
jgi:tetratricopeptide (TPR) repeat protein